MLDYLAHTLEKSGAKASSLLLPEGDELFKRYSSTDYVRIPLMEADMIVGNPTLTCRGERTRPG